MRIKDKIKLKLFRIIWRKNNKHNDTMPAVKFTYNKVCVGKGTYGYLNVREFGNDCKLTIGNYCSIADNVVFLLGGEHNYKRISTFPFKNYYFNEIDAINRGDIVIEDDVWIGYDSLVLSGVTIGKGSVIAARSIVTTDVPPYSVFIGNKVVKKRFSEKIIENISALDFSKLDKEFIINNKEIFETELNDENIDSVMKNFKKYITN